MHKVKINNISKPLMVILVFNRQDHLVLKLNPNQGFQKSSILLCFYWKIKVYKSKSSFRALWFKAKRYPWTIRLCSIYIQSSNGALYLYAVCKCSKSNNAEINMHMRSMRYFYHSRHTNNCVCTPYLFFYDGRPYANRDLSPPHKTFS